MQKINHTLAMVFVGAVTFTIAWPRNAAFAADPAFQVPAGERQLFLDDIGIAKIENLTRTMHQPEKKGAVIRPNWHRGEHTMQIRNAPNWDRQRQVFRFLVSETGGPKTISTVWESHDGLHWSRLGVANIAAYSVVYDPTDIDPARRYKAVSPGRIAVSADLLKWTVVGDPKIPSSDEHNLSFDEKTGLFIMTLKRGGPYGRAHALVTSKDLEHWTDYGVLFHADKLDQELNRQARTARMAKVVADTRLAQTSFHAQGNYQVDIYNTATFRYESHYLAMPAMHPSRRMDLADPSDNIAFKVVQLMCSRDLRTWTRLGDRQDFIGLSPPESGACDIAQAFPPSNAVVKGDELWFYYTGIADIGWPPKTGIKATAREWKYYRPDKGAVCLAVLRRDGFISLDVGETEGAILTEPFELPGANLFVNVDAPKGGLRVELLNGDGKVVAKSKPLAGDLLREPVRWVKGDIADLKGQIASLRFTLRNAQFYSYWLE